MVDNYGADCPIGGGSFSGKDASKVDRSAAYAARHVSRNLVAAGLWAGRGAGRLCHWPNRAGFAPRASPKRPAASGLQRLGAAVCEPPAAGDHRPIPSGQAGLQPDRGWWALWSVSGGRPLCLGGTRSSPNVPIVDRVTNVSGPLKAPICAERIREKPTCGPAVQDIGGCGKTSLSISLPLRATINIRRAKQT